MRRPTWDEYFMFQAISCAVRHSCLKRPVGTLLIKEKRIIGSGYNGAAGGKNGGIKSCLELGYCYYENLAKEEIRKNGGNLAQTKEQFKIYCQAVHAEANAMSQCSRDEASGSTLYITNYPCPKCTQDIIITNQLAAIKVWKEYLVNPTLSIDEQRASEKKLLEAGIAVNFVTLTKERIMEIASYMANIVGERTDYKFENS